MFKILILEDDPQRVYWFYTEFMEDEVAVVNNASVAKVLLYAVSFDLICLDHDLGGQFFVDSDGENTGYQIAKYIPGTINNEATVIIHSYNPKGAEKMYDVLIGDCRFVGNVIRAPFRTWDRKSLSVPK